MNNYKKITSRNNEQIKTLVKLQNSKVRMEEQRFLIEGFKLAYEYLNKVSVPEAVFVREDIIDDNSLLKELPEKIVTCIPASVYDKISTEKSPQGLIFVAKELNNVRRYKKEPQNVYSGGLMLESIRDAGNLGTIIRTAQALGVEKIYLSDDCADIYNPKTLRASMGAVFSADIYICDDLKEIVNEQKMGGGRVFAAMPRGNAIDIRKSRFNESDIIVIGNEGAGISEELASICEAITIPMKCGSESMNAAAAAAIIIWEMQKTKELFL